MSVRVHKKATIRATALLAPFVSLGTLLIAIVPGGQTRTTTVAQNTTYTITDLGTLGGDNSVPIWITNTGDVIGYSDTAQFTTHAFRWSKGVMQDLGTLGDVGSLGLGGNDAGAAVGQTFYNLNHAFLWRDGTITDLGTLVGPGGYGWAQQIRRPATVQNTKPGNDAPRHRISVPGLSVSVRGA